MPPPSRKAGRRSLPSTVTAPLTPSEKGSTRPCRRPQLLKLVRKRAHNVSLIDTDVVVKKPQLVDPTKSIFSSRPGLHHFNHTYEYMIVTNFHRITMEGNTSRKMATLTAADDSLHKTVPCFTLIPTIRVAAAMEIIIDTSSQLDPTSSWKIDSLPAFASATKLACTPKTLFPILRHYPTSRF